MRIISGAASGNTERVSLDYIQINNCGFCEVDDFDMTTNRPSGRADYQLIYVWRGQVRCELPEGPRVLGEGEVIVYRPWERQTYTYLCAQKTQVYWLHFTGQGIPSLLRQSFLNGPTVRVGRHMEARELFEKMIHELQMHQYQYEMYLCSHFMLLLSCLSRHLMTQTGSSEKRGQEALNQVIEFIHAHLYEEVSVEDLARSCRMSTSHFIHQFKDYTGFSPHTYQIRLRLERAKELMNSTTMNISEIAFAVGYNNPLYFSRLFRRHMGLSPSEYRREVSAPSDRMIQ